MTTGREKPCAIRSLELGQFVTIADGRDWQPHEPDEHQSGFNIPIQIRQGKVVTAMVVLLCKHCGCFYPAKEL